MPMTGWPPDFIFSSVGFGAEFIAAGRNWKMTANILSFSLNRFIYELSNETSKSVYKSFVNSFAQNGLD